MSRQIDLGSDTYPFTGTAPAAKRVVVFDGTTHGNVMLPSASPEAKACGVTKEKGSAGGNVAVQLAGIAIVESDGSAVINPGDWITYVGTTGRVKAQALSAGSSAVYPIIGKCVDQKQIPATAGEIVSVLLQPFLATGA